MQRHVRRWRAAGVTVAALGVMASALRAQDAAVVTGRVTSRTGEPVLGVSVSLEQWNYGAQTDTAGVYRFTVPGARVRGQLAELTARRIGYRSATASIRLAPGTVTHDFSLETAPAVLSSVVITGEGTITTQEKLGNTVNTVHADEVVKAAEPNVVEALQAKAPNLQITSQSGDPGAGVAMMIRGPKTFTGTGQPLFVVDGIVFDNSTNCVNACNADVVAPNRAIDLNPNDIENVTILKGAAAAAIYGARAAQGVVLITTKAGQAGPTRYALQSSYSFDEVNKGYDLQRTFGQGDGGAGGTCSGPDCSAGRFSWGPKLAAGTPTFDHFHEMFETGHIQDLNLSISGGDDRRQFFISGGRMDHRGFVVGPNDEYIRNTARLKASQSLTDRLRVGGNISYVDSRGGFVQRGNNTSGIMLSAMRTPPEFDNRHYLTDQGFHRSYRFPNPTADASTRTRGFDNPFFDAYNAPNTSNLGRAFGNLDVDYQPWRWLQVKYTGGADYSNDARVEGVPTSASTFPAGQVTRADFTNYVIDHNLIAIATRALGRGISSTLTVGQNLNSQTFRQVYVNGQALLAPEPFKVTNTVTYTPNDYESHVHSESYFGQLGVDAWDQLFLTAAARNDGSSAFAQNKRRHTYPKASAAWTFSKLLGDAGGRLDFAKARLAYGVTGKEPAVYSTLTAYSVGNFYEYGGQFIRTVYKGQGGLISPYTVGNDSLKPERTREVEYGLDFGLFKGVADAQLTYYDSKSTDVIFSVPTPPSFGYTQQVRNGASISNKGFEAQLNLHPLRASRLQWDLGLVYSRNRNKVLEIVGAEQVFVGTGNFGQSVARAGYPVGAALEFDWVRCRYGEANVVSGVDVNAACKAANAPEGALYIDDGTIGTKGFPTIDYTPRVVGSYQPDWQGGIRNTITLWRNLTLGALVDIRRGGQAWDGTRGALYAYGTHKDTEIRGEKRAFGPSAGGAPGYYTDGPVVGPGVGTVVTLGQDWFQGDGGAFGDQGAQFMEDASYVKLREVSVAYAITRPFVQRALGLSSINVRLAGRNLHTWTDYRGIDPESNLAGPAGYIQGFDWFNNPQTRSVVLSVNLNR
jgi:TonB-linked SusC/RagA family outer membrane protein